MVLSSINNEDSTLINPHHDALVISLLIANCRIKRILVDKGSSTNDIFLSALKEMNIDEAHIHRCSTVLVGFNGEQKFTLGDITLPVYAAIVNLHITFVVLDNPSAYNVILDRPWCWNVISCYHITQRNGILNFITFYRNLHTHTNKHLIT